MWSLLLAAALTTPAAQAAGKATAPTFATDADGKHTADLAFDGLLTTGWAEGGVGPGEGSWLELDLGATTKIEAVSIWPGNLKDGASSYKEYSRPKTIRVLVDGAPQGEPLRLQDEMQRKDIDLGGVSGKVVRIEVQEAYEGGVFADMYIAELAVNFNEGERGRAVEKVDAWRTSAEGKRLDTAFEAQVMAAYEVHKKDSDDRDSMAFLMSAAGDGPEYLRKKVTSLVPIGYRAQAIVADAKAMEAIRKLKDPNGIPGLEMAALRALGREKKDIQEIVEIFYAYADILGGGRRNIPPWGTTGWEPGAFQSYGEPLALEVDPYGQVYVADTGNNRVQRLNTEGVADQQWGAKSDVTNRWFSSTRKWYAGGAAAGEEAGSFVNPIDIELIPGKDGNQFAVLDAVGRVQLFDEQGRVLIGWTVRSDGGLEPRIGGSGYLAWVEGKKQLVAFVGDMAATYTLDSEEVSRWTVKDGTPNAVEAGDDGKLYLVFGDKLITYNPDGFRYGTVGDPKDWGEGFEDVDVTKDEKGQLWILTDTGWVYAYKKPGKVDWKVQVSEVPLEHPRIAVIQGLVFYTDRDRVVRVDALQQHNDELQADQNAAMKQALEEREANPTSTGTDKKKK